MKSLTCAMCKREYNCPEDYLKGTARFRICTIQNLWFECSCHSCLVLKKGEYEWYSPSQTMSAGAASIFQKILEIKQLPMIPTAVMNLQQVIASEQSSSKDIEKALKQAPNIALSVIKTANNIKPATGASINSLEHAVSFVGRKIVSELVITATLQTFEFKTKVFNKHQYWIESIITGKLAEYLARILAPQISKDEAYIAGSLCNIGKVVAAICFPEEIDRVCNRVNDPNAPTHWELAEQELAVFPHSTLGEIAAALWGFPDYVTHAISYHHSTPSEVRDLGGDEVEFFDNDDAAKDEISGPTNQQIVALANQYMHWVLLEPTRMNEERLRAYAMAVGLNTQAMDCLGEELMQFRGLASAS